MINNTDIDVLDQGFYSQDASEVAKMLLGKTLVRQYGDIRMSGRIVETEAYSQKEEACHGYRSRTAKNETLFLLNVAIYLI